MGWVLEGYLMKRFLSVVSFVALLTGWGVAANAADCADDPKTTGLARTIAIEAAGGGFYGRLQYKETTPLLRPKEIVLTFDDGPHPTNTKSILETLDRHCVKASRGFTNRKPPMRWHPTLPARSRQHDQHPVACRR